MDQLYRCTCGSDALQWHEIWHMGGTPKPVKQVVCARLNSAGPVGQLDWLRCLSRQLPTGDYIQNALQRYEVGHH